MAFNVRAFVGWLLGSSEARPENPSSQTAKTPRYLRRQDGEPERIVAGIWGVTGSGKSQTARAVLRHRKFLPKRRFVFDVNKDYVEGIDVEKVANSRGEVWAYIKLRDVEGNENTNEFSVAYRPAHGADLREESGWLATLAWATQYCVLILDEAHRYCRRHEVHPAILTVGLQARKRRVSVVFISPRPVHVDLDLRAETRRETYVLYLDAEDLETIREVWGKDVALRVARLPDLHGILITRNQLTPFRVIIRESPLPPSLEYGPPEAIHDARAIPNQN